MLTMTDTQPIYRFLPKKRNELPLPMHTPAPTLTPSTESVPSEIRLERIDNSVPATKPLSNSGWDVADLLKEWRKYDFA